MSFYGNSIDATGLAGTVIADISSEMEEIVNNWIDSKIRPEGFTQLSATEYYDIRKDDQDELVLKNFPVISITTLTNEARATTPKVIDSSNYVCDLDSGIIQLDGANASNNAENIIEAFAKGFNSVKVEYDYGYASVPGDIVKLATLLLAKWSKIKSEQATSNGLKSVSAGDYKETFDLEFMGVKSEFDEMITELFRLAKIKYSRGV
jgi:hypothetical protein